MLRISLFGLSNRRKQPERYAKYNPKIFKKIMPSGFAAMLTE
jgi:hypothetical protein